MSTWELKSMSINYTRSNGHKTQFFRNSFYCHGLSMNPFKPRNTPGFCLLSIYLRSNSLNWPGCCVRDVCRPVRKGTNLFVRQAESIFRNEEVACSGRFFSKLSTSVQPGCRWILSLSCRAFSIMVMIDLGHRASCLCANWLLMRSQSQNRWWDVSPSHIKECKFDLSLTLIRVSVSL